MKLFGFSGIADEWERTYGFSARVFGLDVSLMLLGWVSDWRIIDLRIPCNYGMYLQVGPILTSIGRLADDSIYKPKGD